jgi:hypothetical protein
LSKEDGMSKKKLAGIIVACIIVVIVVVVITATRPTPTYKLSVSVSPSGAGSISPSGGEYESGVQVTLTASPASGYRFVNWTGNVGTIANVNAATTSITINDHYSITANFAIPTVECKPAGTFTSERYQPGEWDYAISIARTEAGDFVSGTIELTAPDEGKVVAVIEAVKCNYACWYDNPLVSKPNFAAVGTATYGDWEGNFMFLFADSHIQMVLSTEDYSDEWATETLWAPGVRAYDIWSDDGGFWVDCLCPDGE